MTPSNDRSLARSGHYANDPWSAGRRSGALVHAGPQRAEAQQPVSPLKRVQRLLRGRMLLASVLATCGAIAGGAAGYKALKPQYRSDGLIEIKPFLVSPLQSERDAVMPLYEKYVQSQANILMSQRVIQRAMESEDWKALNRGNSPEATEKFIKGLDVSYVDGSFLIRVSFSDPDPKVAPVAVKAMIRSYKEIYGDVDTVELRNKMALVERSKNEAIQQKRTLDQQILAVADKYGTENLGPFVEAASQELVRLGGQLTEAELALRAAEAANRKGAAAATQKSADPALAEAAKKQWTVDQIARADGGLMATYLSRVENAEQEVQRLKMARLGDGHRLVQDAQAKLDAARKRVDEYAAGFRADRAADPAPAPGGHAALAGMDADQLRSQVEALREMVTKKQEEATGLGKAYLTIRQYQNEVESLKEKIAEYTKRIEQNDAEMRMNVTGRIQIRSEGDVPVTPFIDKRKQAGVLGLVFGGALPVGLLLLVGFMDQRFQYSDDAGATAGGPGATGGMPLLGILPNLPDLLTDPKQAAIAAHCVHQVRTMLQIRVAAEDSQVFSVTSASPGDGKTSLTLALGLSFAASGSRTLLIDCDLVGAALSRRLRIDTAEGILEAMAAGKATGQVVDTDIENLSVLPAGGSGLHHTGSFSPSALRRLIADARKNFDIVLVDTGPILGSIEASAVAAASDGVILVVSRGQQRPLVERSVGQLNAIGAPLAGVVFNRAEANDFEKTVSRFSQRSIRPGEDGHTPAGANGNGNRRHGHEGNGNGHKQAYGPVAGAVATSFKPGSDS